MSKENEEDIKEKHNFIYTDHSADKNTLKACKPVRNSNTKKLKKTNTAKSAKVEGITKSKLLLSKQNNRQRTNRNVSTQHTQPRVCGNGKPMPSLAELEKMFEDSDEESPTLQEKEPSKDIVKPFSPVSLEEFTEKVINCMDKLADSANSVVYPVKTTNKNKDPYIVGCKDREQILKKFQSKFGQGDTKYGVNSKDNAMKGENEDQQKKRKRSKIKNPSTSLFNEKTDEIVEMLKESDNTGFSSDGSTDSNRTLAYDVGVMSPLRKRPCKFSPIPSTSKDNETFIKNEIKLNESLHLNYENSSDNEIEVIDLPCETILLDDEDSSNNGLKINIDSDVEEVSNDIEPKYDIPLIDLDFDYNFEVNQSQDCEIIDVDDVIAETQAVINKLRPRKLSCEITHVSSPNNVPFKSPNPQSNTLFPPQNSSLILSKRNESKHKKSFDTLSPPENKIGETIKEFFINWNNPNSNRNNIAFNTLPNNINVYNPKVLKDAMNYLIAGAQAIIKKCAREKPSPDLTEVIDLSSTPVKPVTPLNELNTSHNNSVIFVPSSRCTNNARPQKKRQCKKKSATSALPPLIPISPNNTRNVTNIQRDEMQLNANPSKTNNNGNSSTSNQSLITPPSSIQNFGECPICYENFTKTNMASTICGHLFCIGCIEKTIRKSGKRCPSCRKPLKGNGYHKIYL